jgi:TonB family protein
MTLPSFTIKYKGGLPLRRCRQVLIFACSLFLLTTPLAAQRLAILAPDKTDQSQKAAAALRASMVEKAQVLDEMLAASAYDSTTTDTPFNLTTEDTKKIGAAVGCDFLVLVRSTTLRRSASDRPEYYEANAAIFVVSARTGNLVYFGLLKYDAPKPTLATEKLMRSLDSEASKIVSQISSSSKAELDLVQPPAMEEVPEPNTPGAKNFRAPIPYRRIKPVYTADAAYYDITATVDIEVDLNAEGKITRTQIKRWAGYGLDEAVETAVRSMNWRPAERNGRSIPIRVLLRYNFKKVDKE